MKAVLQRVSKASVAIDGRKHHEIGPGIVLLLGIRDDDISSDVQYIVDKTLNMRIFNDEMGRMNKSIFEAFEKPQCLVISNFTIYGDARKGRRPSFIKAAKADKAIAIYDEFISEMINFEVDVKTGIFGENMQIELINDGPVTIVFSSDHRKEEE